MPPSVSDPVEMLEACLNALKSRGLPDSAGLKPDMFPDKKRLLADTEIQLAIIAVEAEKLLKLQPGDALFRIECDYDARVAVTGIALLPAYPGSERLRGATNLLGNGTDSFPLRAVLMLAFKNQAGGTLTHLGGKLIVFCHPVTSLKEFSLQETRYGSLTFFVLVLFLFLFFFMISVD